MGQLDSAAVQPRRGDDSRRVREPEQTHDVAVQVAFERQTLKPVFHLDRL
jgi:hypothetical protein